MYPNKDSYSESSSSDSSSETSSDFESDNNAESFDELISRRHSYGGLPSQTFGFGMPYPQREYLSQPPGFDMPTPQPLHPAQPSGFDEPFAQHESPSPDYADEMPFSQHRFPPRHYDGAYDGSKYDMYDDETFPPLASTPPEPFPGAHDPDYGMMEGSEQQYGGFDMPFSENGSYSDYPGAHNDAEFCMGESEMADDFPGHQVIQEGPSRRYEDFPPPSMDEEAYPDDHQPSYPSHAEPYDDFSHQDMHDDPYPHFGAHLRNHDNFPPQSRRRRSHSRQCDDPYTSSGLQHADPYEDHGRGRRRRRNLLMSNLFGSSQPGPGRAPMKNDARTSSMFGPRGSSQSAFGRQPMSASFEPMMSGVRGSSLSVSRRGSMETGRHNPMMSGPSGRSASRQGSMSNPFNPTMSGQRKIPRSASRRPSMDTGGYNPMMSGARGSSRSAPLHGSKHTSSRRE